MFTKCLRGYQEIIENNGEFFFKKIGSNLSLGKTAKELCVVTSFLDFVHTEIAPYRFLAGFL